MEGTIGEIRMFAGNFAPKSWALCQGQLLAISQNTALFSILGTTYGGDGRTTFGLPNLQGRVALGIGNGPGLSGYVLGEQTGSESVTLLAQNLPPHSHLQNGSGDPPTQNSAGGASLATNGRATNPPMPNVYAANANNPIGMGSMTGTTGGGQPVSLIQPVLGINYIVCLYGVFPSRN